MKCEKEYKLSLVPQPFQDRLAKAKKEQEDSEKQISEQQAIINGADRVIKKVRYSILH